MKLSGIALFAGIAVSAIAAAPVAAQDHVSEHRVEVHRTHDQRRPPRQWLAPSHGTAPGLPDALVPSSQGNALYLAPLGLIPRDAPFGLSLAQPES